MESPHYGVWLVGWLVGLRYLVVAITFFGISTLHYENYDDYVENLLSQKWRRSSESRRYLLIFKVITRRAHRLNLGYLKTIMSIAFL